MTSVTSAPPAAPTLTPTVVRLLSHLALPPGRGAPEWLTVARRTAGEWATRRGFPTRHDEDWRYTPLGPLLAESFERGEAATALQVSPGSIEQSSIDGSIARLVFVNGFLAPHLSSLSGLPAGVSVTSLAAALSVGGVGLEPYFSPATGEHVHAYQALNTALAEDGALIRVAPGTTVDGLIELLFYSDIAPSPVMSNPRSIILAGAGSQLAVVETYSGAVGARMCTNAVTQVVVGPGATVDHYKIQDEPDNGYHLGLLDVRQGPDSRFSSLSVALGARLARHEVRVRLEGPDADATINGLYLPGGDRHHDQPVLIEHAARRGTSRQLYKGIATDRGHGVFNGRIVVLPEAPGTDARQTNLNLLLSDLAEIDTRPRLEILTDDVKCTHGAAVGALDPDAVFYLRSRGVPLQQAEAMLTAAFAHELLDTIDAPALRAHLETLVDAHLTTRPPAPDVSPPQPRPVTVANRSSAVDRGRTGQT
jgi:Fe-S cluster assembly protein SufD